MLKPLFVSALVLLFGLLVKPSHGIDLTWGGGTGRWTSANWNGGQTAPSITGFGRGNGRVGDRFVIDGPGSKVEYYPDQDGGDFAPQQGVSYALTNGGTLDLITNPAQDGSRWTLWDASQLTVDGGMVRRQGRALETVGMPGGDGGGGAFVLGSWRADDRANPAAIAIEIKNGGLLDNEGQLWFGAYTDHPSDLRVSMMVNNGSVDLHGGEVPLGNVTGYEYAADLVFTYRDAGRSEDYSIDFTGPGSLTVDRAGIKIIEFAESTFLVEENRSYLDLWNRGLLRANGKSGLTANGPLFSDLFDVSGTPGQDDYRLTTKGFVVTDPCDLNADGAIDAADAAAMFGDWGGPGSTSRADKNNDGFVDAADAGAMFAVWTGDPTPVASPANVQVVPEPASLTLLGILFFLRISPIRRQNGSPPFRFYLNCSK